MARPIRRNYDFAGAFVMLSGLFHLPLFLIEGTSPHTKLMFFVGLVWMGIGLWLRGRHRWLAYIAFVLMLFGAVYAFAQFGGTWWWWLIFLMDILAVYYLFRILWPNKKAPH